MMLDWIRYTVVVAACATILARVADLWLVATGRARRFAWLGVFVSSLVVPLVVAVRPRVVAAPDAASLILPTATTVLTGSGAFDPSAWLGGLWAVGSCVLVALLAGGLLQLSRARRHATRAMLAGREVAVTRELGPGAVPFGQPRILVPSWARELAPESLRLLVNHEAEHVRAGDARLLLAAAFMVAIMPWNVPLWWALRRLRTAIEVDCDARVLRAEPTVAPYAELLLQVAGRVRARVPALLALTDTSKQLNERIDAMTIVPILTPARRIVLGALALAALVVACETRQPEPVAPISERVAKAEVTVATADSLPATTRLLDKVQEAKSKIIGPVTAELTPELVVQNHNGKVVYRARVRGEGEAERYVPSSDVAQVELMPSTDPEAAGGPTKTVRVILKPNATWKPGVEEGALLSKVRGDEATSGAAERAEAEEFVRLRDVPSAEIVNQPAGIRVILRDARGNALYEGPMDPLPFKEAIGPFRIKADMISTVNVIKDTPDRTSGRIYITLKPGLPPERR